MPYSGKRPSHPRQNTAVPNAIVTQLTDHERRVRKWDGHPHTHPPTDRLFEGYMPGVDNLHELGRGEISVNTRFNSWLS